MELRKNTRRRRARLEARALAALLCMLGVSFALPVLAQETADAAAASAPEYSAAELDDLVGRIALYPDDLIAIILPASTYPLEVVEAARFEEKRKQDPSLKPNEDWEDSIVALLNYPEVLKLMNDDLDWTAQLGEAVAAQQADVFDAIQRFRGRALAAGNLKSDEHQVVSEDGGDVEIKPADPKVVYVPYYAPERVVVRGYGPLYYYPYAYPLYYYPYPAGYSFDTGFFFGVTTAFVIGWHAHYIHVDPCTYIGHPYFGRHYYAPLYVRHSITVSLNLVGRGHGAYAWRPNPHRRRYGHAAHFTHFGRARHTNGRPHHTNAAASHRPNHFVDHGRASGGSPAGRASRFRAPRRSAPGTHAGTAPRATRRNGNAGAVPRRTAPHAAAHSGGSTIIGGIASRTFRPSHSRRSSSDGARIHLPHGLPSGRAQNKRPRSLSSGGAQTHRSHGSSSGRAQTYRSHGPSPGNARTHRSHGSSPGRAQARRSHGSSPTRAQPHRSQTSGRHGNGHRSTGNAIRGGRSSER